jgi:hypothetical protein
LSPARPAQSQAAEPQDTLEMCKQHLNALSVMARSLECDRVMLSSQAKRQAICTVAIFRQINNGAPHIMTRSSSPMAKSFC